MPVTALDLVNNVAEKKPSEFQHNFSELVTDRIRDLLAGKRVEVAKNLFNPQPPVEAAPEKTEDGETKDQDQTASDEKETTDANDSAEATA